MAQCKSEIIKMKPAADGLEDQVNWKISYVNIDDQCDVYKSHHKHTAIATTTCTCQGDQDQNVGSSSTGMSGYKLSWIRGAVESTSPGCWMNQEQTPDQPFQV